MKYRIRNEINWLTAEPEYIIEKRVLYFFWIPKTVVYDFDTALKTINHLSK